MLLASSIWLVVNPLGRSSWRYMFVIGILPALLLLYVRRWVEEPAIWMAASRNRREAQQRVQMGSGSSHDKQLAQFTVSEILSDSGLRRRVGFLLLMAVSSVVGWWSASTWIPEFATELTAYAGNQPQLSSSSVGLIFGTGSVVGFLALGWLADFVGRKPTICLYYFGALVLSLSYFLFTRQRIALLVMAGANGFFASGQFAWMTIYLPELFPTRIRGTAMSLVFDTSRAIAGLAPLFAGWLVTRFGGIGNAAALMSLIYVVGLIAAPFAGEETKRKPLPV